MTELKTLKDFQVQPPYLWDEKKYLEHGIVKCSRLREEAIKWIKTLKNSEDITCNYDGFCLICQKHTTYSQSEYKHGFYCEHKSSDKLTLFEDGDEVDCWIKCFTHFFNITEEDLK